MAQQYSQKEESVQRAGTPTAGYQDKSVMMKSIPAGAPTANSAPAAAYEQRRDEHDGLLHIHRNPLFNLLHKWYLQARAEVAAKEQAL